MFKDDSKSVIKILQKHGITNMDSLKVPNGASSHDQTQKVLSPINKNGIRMTFFNQYSQSTSAATHTQRNTKCNEEIIKNDHKHVDIFLKQIT